MIFFLRCFIQTFSLLKFNFLYFHFIFFVCCYDPSFYGVINVLFLFVLNASFFFLFIPSCVLFVCWAFLFVFCLCFSCSYDECVFIRIIVRCAFCILIIRISSFFFHHLFWLGLILCFMRCYALIVFLRCFLLLLLLLLLSKLK